MKRESKWLLPDGVDEVLPPDAEPLEALRREFLDTFKRWGYQLVLPPLVEFLESLHPGQDDDLNLQTFKITDQTSGRLMGVRADITPQVARIDAHRLPTDCPQRLCYVGPVLHTRPDNFAGSRNPLQIGAELYGHLGIESDAEIVCLMADVLRLAGLNRITVELGHMGVFKALTDAASMNADAVEKLLDGLLRKTEDEVLECLDDNQVVGAHRKHLLGLLRLNGGIDVVNQAQELFSDAPTQVRDAITALGDLVALLSVRIPDVDLHIDLAELRGYRYHTGVTFAAYSPGEGRQIAWGGRYDDIGGLFGRNRPATGFSTDLKNLIAGGRAEPRNDKAIFAPAGDDAQLLGKIAQLRDDGCVVVQQLPGQHGAAAEMQCNHQLVNEGGEWCVREFDT